MVPARPPGPDSQVLYLHLGWGAPPDPMPDRSWGMNNSPRAPQWDSAGVRPHHSQGTEAEPQGPRQSPP